MSVPVDAAGVPEGEEDQPSANQLQVGLEDLFLQGVQGTYVGGFRHRQQNNRRCKRLLAL
jgi:hypothetical protein